MGICMKCFQIDLNELPKVALWGKEALIPPRLHYSRYLTEYVMYVVIKGELKLMVNEDVVVLGTGDVYIFCNGDLQESLESSSIGTPKSDKSNTRRGYDTARAIAEYIELHYAESITGSLIERKFFLTYDYVNSEQ